MFRSVVKKDLVLYPTMELQPFYSTRDFVGLVTKFPGAQICAYNQFLGVIPVEICDIFPAAHHVSSACTATRHQAKDYPSFLESLNNFLAHNTFENITIIANDFMHDLLYNNKHKDKLNARIFDYKEGLVFEL
jgi:7-cyano-7-deazaguanine tRNA-ribosyltransferase